ncbi:hypothetical protein PY650_00690 [Rhizobium calliandrae]|uniref:Uncharacterized protein n=2 Tax=Rhizobium TaxID=379 RepID=A0ABT7K6H0_9HYPH|nr:MULTISPECIES: hypothetical protein [Rhizobium]MDL2403011.1 hypothetical protein [Rhizobium mayense]MDL2404196.1 hypothetical protein [Rhizobium calliandrae]
MIAIRQLLVGLTLILALVLIALSILLVNPVRPIHQSDNLIPMQAEPVQQRQ